MFFLVTIRVLEGVWIWEWQGADVDVDVIELQS